ncbi:MAG: hypothetical protein JSV77_10450 [Dehalococcoidales bacterium]|nr:MAG: hypothetical protein JSV77_10450 [Dehalococcoidales bacterium]
MTTSVRNPIVTAFLISLVLSTIPILDKSLDYETAFSLFFGDYLMVQMRMRTRSIIIMGFVVTVITITTIIGTISIVTGAIPGPIAIMC